MSFFELTAEEKRYFHFQPRGSFDTEPHFHSAIEFLFVERGEQEVVIGGEKRILYAGDACFSDSFCVHSYDHKPNTAAYVFLGEKSYFDNFFLAQDGKVPPRFFQFHDFSLLKNLLQLCTKNYRSNATQQAVFEGSAHILLATIAEETEFVTREVDKQTSFIANVLQYAQEHLKGDLSLSALSRVFGYSQEHLSRLLHKYLAENWTTYVNRLRARHAHALLQENGSVLDIAFDCGFESLSTFYRAYHLEYGKNPRR